MTKDRAPIDFHIEELVLHGFSLRDRDAITEQLRNELGRLLTEQGLPAEFTHDVSLRNLRGTEIRLNAGSDPSFVGTQIARSVYASFSGL